MGETWTVDNWRYCFKFLDGIKTRDCFMGFGEIRFLKWHDLNNSNSWFLAIVNGISQGFSLFKQMFC